MGRGYGKQVWQRIPFTTGSGSLQLGRDLVMLERAGEGLASLRWYAFDPACLVLGRGQSIKGLDLERCAIEHLAVVRRPSGGGAVLAGPGLLALSVALPVSHGLACSDVTASYAWLGEALSQALRRLGAAGARALAPAEARAANEALGHGLRAGGLSSEGCFGSFSPYEVVVGRRKLAGLCQTRRRGAVLYQAGLLLRPDLGAELHCLGDVPWAPEWSEAIEQRSVGLYELLGGAAMPRTIADCFEQVLLDRHGARLARLRRASWLPEDELRAAELGRAETLFEPTQAAALGSTA